MIRAVISDFGGVLTTPIIESFLAYQRESGIGLEDLGKAMAQVAGELGMHAVHYRDADQAIAELRALVP